MNSRLLVLTVLCVSLIQATGQFPFVMPEVGGIFSSLLDAPYVAEVSELSSSDTSFSVRLTREDQVSSTYARTSSVQNLESEFVAHLKTGQRYRFPQCVIDLLGREKALEIVRTRPGKSLSQFTSEVPFRAVVLDQGIGENNYSIILQETGGRLHHFQGILNEPNMHQVALGLSRGRSYEFPATIEDALLSREERLEKSKPKTPGTAVLLRYLGSWHGHLDDHPEAKIEMTCHPRADGSGIWREITFNDGTNDLPPVPDIAIVEYDRAEKVYTAFTLPPGTATPLQSTWDEKTQTFTTALPTDEKRHRRINTATFSREDRIDWRTITLNKKGETHSMTSGHYERLRSPDAEEGEPVPPTPYTGSMTLPFTMRTVPQPPGSSPPYFSTLAGLSSSPPFRAKLTSIVVTDDSISLQLLHTNGQYNTRTENRRDIGKSDLCKALSLLKKDETYEFPYCLEHPGLQEADKPATPEMKALELFIGKWSGRVRDEAGTPGQILPATTLYFWSADGSALWREYYTPGGSTTVVNGKTVQLQEHTSLTRITYDPATREYVETNENSSASPTGVRASWDADKQSYTWKGTLDAPSGMNGGGTRTFTTPDLVEWQASRFKMDGTLIDKSSGTYERIKP